MQKVSIIVTVLNEELTIFNLLESIAKQTVLPNEVIIIDGGSTDGTVKIIKIFSQKNPQLHLQVKIKKGNRSIGRNYAVQLAKHSLIAITDAGCVLDKKWLQELVTHYAKSNSTKVHTPVIAGYYSAKPKTDFQKAVVPYVLVMPDRVDRNNFLPATRSMMIEKKLFEKIGGFDEKLSDNEDYDFARRLVRQKISISFAQKAIVYWEPRKTLQEFYNMVFRFARGDIFSKIVRPKVILIFVRYIFFALLFLISKKIFLGIFALYCFWAIQKNKRYVGGGYIYLPILQIVSDFAVMLGSVQGFLKRFIQ